MKPDEKTIQTVTDVLVRFREHGQYGNEEKALRALARRCPWLTRSQCEAIFRFYDSLLAETIRATTSPRTSKALRESRALHLSGTGRIVELARPAIVEQVRERFPGHSRQELEAFANWTIYWHLLR